MIRQAPRGLWLILAVAFFLRLGAGVSQHYFSFPFPERPVRNWWNTGYTHYGQIAVDLAEGRGLRTELPVSGVWRAIRVPLYPILLSGLYRTFGKRTFPPLLLHALIGAASVFLAFLIAREIFGLEEGMAAGLLAMVYPYYIGHDTALQETALLTFLAALSVYWLLAAARSGARREALFAGVALGLGVLCRQTIIPFIPLSMIWLYWTASGPRRKALGNTLAMGLVSFMLLVPLMVRNRRVIGYPVISTGFGWYLWAGTNDFIEGSYPGDSIDVSVLEALEAFEPEEKALLAGLGEWERDRWFLARALKAISEKPGRALALAGVKIMAAFSPWINRQDGGRPRAWLHALGYVPLLAAAIYSLLHWSASWRAPALFGLLGLSFTCASVFAFAHTSHRTYLDIYLMVLASSPAARLLSRVFERSGGSK